MTGLIFKGVPLLLVGTKLRDRENLKSSKVLPDFPQMFFAGRRKGSLLCLYFLIAPSTPLKIQILAKDIHIRL